MNTSKQVISRFRVLESLRGLLPFQHQRNLVLVCFEHREPTQSVCVGDSYFIVNVLDLPLASSIAICR